MYGVWCMVALTQMSNYYGYIIILTCAPSFEVGNIPHIVGLRLLTRSPILSGTEVSTVEV